MDRRHRKPAFRRIWPQYDYWRMKVPAASVDRFHRWNFAFTETLKRAHARKLRTRWRMGKIRPILNDIRGTNHCCAITATRWLTQKSIHQRVWRGPWQKSSQNLQSVWNTFPEGKCQTRRKIQTVMPISSNSCARCVVVKKLEIQKNLYSIASLKKVSKTLWLYAHNVTYLCTWI